jgi:hypothetical protein
MTSEQEESHAKVAAAAAKVMQDQLQRIAELERELHDLATAVIEYEEGPLLGADEIRAQRADLLAKAHAAWSKRENRPAEASTLT